MSVSKLRDQIQTQFLKNNIISAKEAKQIIKTLADDGLSATEKAALDKIRVDFRDGFSASGLAAFDKALARVPVETSNTPAPANSTSILDMQLGRSMDRLPTSFDLSEITDPNVRDALSRFDFNTDGRVTTRDREMMGFSEQQWQAFTFGALLLGARIQDGTQVPQDLAGKKVCFTAVPDKQKMTEWAEAMGAEVVSEVSPDLDFLVVGDATSTGKDERALALNTLGEASIGVAKLGAFLSSANAAGVTGPPPADISRADYDQAVESTIKDWFEGYIRDGYEYEMAHASGAELDRLRELMQGDLDGFDLMLNPDDLMSDYIYDRYDDNEPYVDRFGVPVPHDEIDVLNFDFFTELAGIGLSKTFVFDRRNGNLLDTSDIRD